MNKHKAIPQGYMTVGEVAKKMNTTVRTLQHYDREGFYYCFFTVNHAFWNYVSDGTASESV